MNPQRRAFLFGRSRTQRVVLRPPYALAEAQFLEACSRCEACATACPSKIIVPGEGQYPVIDFTRGECSFCGECQHACQSGALSGVLAEWSAQLAADKCLAHQGVECRVCGESCEVRALTFRPQRGGVSQPQLASELCTGCGACVAPCPTQAIQIKGSQI